MKKKVLLVLILLTSLAFAATPVSSKKTLYPQALWTLNGSDIYNTNQGRVGIGGQPTDDNKLEVKTGLSSEDKVGIGTPGGFPGLALFDENGVQAGNIGVDRSSKEMHLWTSAGNEDQLVLNSSGSVGVGTKTLDASLGVFMNSRSNRAFSSNAGYGDGVVGSYVANYFSASYGRDSSGNLTGLHVDVSNAGSGKTYSGIFTGGNVGVGKTNPVYPLDVAGDVHSDGSLFIGQNLGVGVLDTGVWKLNVKTSSDAGDGIGVGVPGGFPGIAFFDREGKQEGNIGVEPTGGSMHLWTRSTLENQLVLDESGKIGVGTNTPVGALDVFMGANNRAFSSNAGYGNGVQNDFIANYFSAAYGAGSSGVLTGLRVDVSNAGSGRTNAAVFSGGNVGVGKTNPVYLLDVAGDVNSDGSLFVSQNLGVGVSNTGQWKFNVKTSPDAGDGIGVGTPGGYTGIAFMDRTGSQEGNIGVEPTGGGLHLWTRSGLENQLVLDELGNVGIGTQPGAKLEVYQGALRLRGGHYDASVVDISAEGIGGAWYGKIQARDDYPGYGQPRPLALNPDGGSVNIGPIDPSEKLDVDGFVKGRSGLCIGNDCRSQWPAGGGGGGIGGSGSPGYLAKFTDSVTIGNSIISESSGVVSVGGSLKTISGGENAQLLHDGSKAILRSSTGELALSPASNGWIHLSESSGKILRWNYGNSKVEFQKPITFSDGSGGLDMNGERIGALPEPASGSDAATKSYVDSRVGGPGLWSSSGDNIYNTNNGNVGIGVTNPSEKLAVSDKIRACTGNAVGCGVVVSDDGGFYDDNDGWIKFKSTQPGKGLMLSGSANNLQVDGNLNLGGRVTSNLQVDGTVKIAGTITSDGDICIGAC